MNLRRLFASTAIVCFGLAMFMVPAQIPRGNVEIEILCAFIGPYIALVGLLYPFKLGWRTPVFALLGWIALGCLLPWLSYFFR